MRSRVALQCVIAITLLTSAAFAGTYSIPEDSQDSQKIYWGSPDSFDQPASVNYRQIVKATPEYKSIKKDKIEEGTAKYWILLSQASERALSAIADVGSESEYDLIAASGYLGSLEPPIASTDITKLVLEKLKDGE